MSSNADTAMTRFLFAILKQKNLKDIDWTKVAHDPILAQEITNGHAARMRYSRFRSAMLGLEPTRRNRTGPPKSRVTKSKKNPKAPAPPKRDENVKSEQTPPGVGAGPTPQEPSEISAAPKIKQENLQQHSLDKNRLENRLSPGLTPGPPGPMPALSPSMTPMTATPHTMQQRLLTPCSDTDVFVSALSASPSSEMINSQTPFDFSQPPCPAHDDSAAAWHQAMSSYPPFSSPYVYDDFTAATATCDHQHLHHPHPHDHFGLQHGLHLPSIETDGDHDVDVKHEQPWEHCG